MSGRRLIDPSEIREGDVIEMVSNGWATRCTVGEVTETRIYNTEQQQTWLPTDGKDEFYLLDRPAPPVELPKTPTIGVVTWKWNDSKVTQSETALWNLTEDGLCFRSESSSIPVTYVINFAPIRVLADDETVVPTEALAALREVEGRCDATYPDYSKAIRVFLAAIPEANG